VVNRKKLFGDDQMADLVLMEKITNISKTSRILSTHEKDTGNIASEAFGLIVGKLSQSKSWGFRLDPWDAVKLTNGVIALKLKNLRSTIVKADTNTPPYWVCYMTMRSTWVPNHWDCVKRGRTDWQSEIKTFELTIKDRNDGVLDTAKHWS
jgi:hypothetical protein